MEWGALAALGGVLLLGAMSPGPSFWLVVQLALGQPRRVAVGAALGMGVGAVCFAMLAASGWQRQIAPEWLQAVRFAGAAFLCWLGYRMWRGAGVAVPASARTAGVLTLWQGVLAGCLAQLSNPKTLLVYAAVFAALLPVALPLAAHWPVVLVVWLVEAGWYALVACAFSSARVRQGYLRQQAIVDRLAALAMLCLGLWLAFTA